MAKNLPFAQRQLKALDDYTTGKQKGVSTQHRLIAVDIPNLEIKRQVIIADESFSFRQLRAIPKSPPNIRDTVIVFEFPYTLANGPATQQAIASAIADTM